MESKKIIDKNDSNIIKKSRFITLQCFIKSNKFPLLVTLGFLLGICYVDFAINNYWNDYDGIYYLHQGEAILNGHGNDIKQFNAPIGGPLVFATLNSLFNDGFLTVKIISILSGTGIVFASYYIIRNIFSSKVALVGQLFLAFNTQFHWVTIQGINELLPLLFIFISLYFITKKFVTLSDVIIVGALLGISFMIRYQASLVLLTILIFLIIRNRNVRVNLSHAIIMGIFFLIAASPLFIYNYSTERTFIVSHPNDEMIIVWQYQTLEWHDKMEKIITSGENTSGIFLDFNLFLKNYFYNLLYYNANRLFDFHTSYSLSIIPYIPFLGIIPVLGGLFYSLKAKLNKTNLSILFGTAAITAVFVFLLGDFKTHFFAIIIIPVLVFGIIHIRKIEKNLLPLLILSVVFYVIISIFPLGRPDQLFGMWIVIPTLSALFIIETLPKMYSKFRKRNLASGSESKTRYKIIVLIIILILIINLVFSFRMQEVWLYEDFQKGLLKDFLQLLKNKGHQHPWGAEIKQIGDILSKQPGIKNSYVMAVGVNYAYYANSKFVYSDFQEGVRNDTLDRFFMRENWTPADIYYSNLNSWPSDRRDVYHPIPDYVVYFLMDPFLHRDVNKTQYYDLQILAEPTNPKIPSNFKVLYHSNSTGTTVYKIIHKITNNTN